MAGMVVSSSFKGQLRLSHAHGDEKKTTLSNVTPPLSGETHLSPEREAPAT